MTTPPNNACDAPVTQPPWVLRLLAWGVCPLFFAVAVYEFCYLLRVFPAAAQPFFGNGLALFLCSTVIFIATLSGVMWHYGDFQATRANTIREMGLKGRLHYQEELLRLITDNVPNSIFICDLEGHLWFANKNAGAFFNSDAYDILGKSIHSLLPQKRASLLLGRVMRANAENAPVIAMDRLEDQASLGYMQTHHIPLNDAQALHRCVLVTQRDMTDSIVEHEKQEQAFKQLVNSLVAIIDRRDPYAAGHSLRVGGLAQAIAIEMDLDAQSIDACYIAGSVMNLGKIMVPRSILVKTTALDNEELRLVRKSMLASADILSLIHFETPVIPTLRQVLERYDGSGEPERRRGENIIITARIVAVANAFVAMVSPRAHRSGLVAEVAFSVLRKEAGKAYDGRVIEALIRYMDKNPQEKISLLEPPGEMQGTVLSNVPFED